VTTDEDFQISRESMLGVPITGDYNEGVDWGEQKTPAEFAAILQPILDDPEIIRFGWHQYTPFFNDGDTCDFTTYRPWFLTRADEVALDGNLEDFDDDDYEVGSSYSPHPTIGHVVDDRDWRNGGWVDNPNAGEFIGPDRDRYDRCLALTHAIDSSSCFRVLLDAFGDHAEVTFSRDADTGEWRAQREYYSHE
jgi:hypothetical protein